MHSSKHLLRVAAVAAALFLGGPVSAATPAAAVSVVDGDTIQIGSEVYPLYGIDAPELGQLCIDGRRWHRCGFTAAFELRKLLKFDGPVHCEPAPAEPGRFICTAARADLALLMLKGGYVVAAPQSEPAYRQAELQAREGNLGLWHMTFVSPWEWRDGKQLPGEAAAEAAKCPIKGIVEAGGRKIYYVPTDAVYKDIEIDPSAGERLFCSIGAAAAAGWRRPETAGR